MLSLYMAKTRGYVLPSLGGEEGGWRSKREEICNMRMERVCR